MRVNLPDTSGTGGLCTSVRVLATTLAALAQTRVALFGTEVEAELSRVVALLIGAMIALAFGGLALLFIALLIVGAFWEDHRIAALGAVAAGFSLVAVIAALVVRAGTKRGASLFADTVGQFEQDWKRLSRGGVQ